MADLTWRPRTSVPHNNSLLNSSHWMNHFEFFNFVIRFFLNDPNSLQVTIFQILPQKTLLSDSECSDDRLAAGSLPVIPKTYTKLQIFEFPNVFNFFILYESQLKKSNHSIIIQNFFSINFIKTR